MKKLSLFLAAILFAVTGVFAQTPEEFKYQSVLRDANGNVIANQNKTVVIDILEGSPSGASVFTESHSITTNENGLISLNVGSVEDMSTVDWSSNDYFIQITVDGTLMGATQLLSVPYALMAKNVENDDVGDGSETVITAGYHIGVVGSGTESDPYVINGVSSNDITYSIGLNEDLGGYVFYVTPDGRHGLVCATADYPNPNDANWWMAQDYINLPEKLPAMAQNFTDWRMPTRQELLMMYQHKAAIGGFQDLVYESSTEVDSGWFWGVNFLDGSDAHFQKDLAKERRVVRSF